MKTLAIALILAASAGPIIETANGARFEIVANTAELSQNSLGATQASANIIFQDPDKSQPPETMKVGVVGCNAGKGVIVLFDIDGNPVSGPHNWTFGGKQAFDGISQAVCEIARVRSQARSTRGWV
jgi:hypothetical protein